MILHDDWVWQKGADKDDAALSRDEICAVLCVQGGNDGTRRTSCW